MDAKLKNINWRTYREVYPDRYLKRSYFDSFIDRMVKSGQTILDIGGGTKGTLTKEQAENNRVWLCDPFIPGVPEGYRAKDDPPLGAYDLIIIRGTFNYLHPLHIIGLKDNLKPGGIIIFNTFREPTEIFRQYTKNKKVMGYEKTIFYPRAGGKDGDLHHYLIPSVGEIIHHIMFYYSNDFISNNLFKGMSVQTRFNGNSAIYVISHEMMEIEI